MMRVIDWQRLEDLEKKKREEMTDEEWDFFKWMYHVEEFNAHLDGDD